MYSLPYPRPPKTLALRLERAHRAGINLAMGVPASTSTEQVYAEAPNTPLIDVANDRALSQLLGLHVTAPGRRIL